ncbi:transglutaminaseTgpA domain-containing protein [Pseudoalteromonas sp. H105]|uniref:transglutaminase family protein n=1 Tax=Pseudoalteromonas sp. H105 TaxID=1348393 RepID=UPI0007322096|nr:DUF3488 and transglutaminase-like domain-containing protein [Pseudoalteromonas sp. H105]KTF18254.1 transglutaminase [Pseudoalteromonas sp. H105]
MTQLKNTKPINLLLSLIYLAVVMALATELSVAFSVLLGFLCVWNLAITLTNKKKPHTILANILAGLCLLFLLYDVGLGDTVTLFVAMLILSSLFKLLQARNKKHYQTIVLLSFFSLSTVYLFSQSLLSTLLVSVLYILNFAALMLIESTHKIKLAVKQSTKMLALALPIAVFLVIFLPKLPAFWQLPGPKLAKTGLSESVNPFDIAKLSRSDELVFRAKFSNTNKPNAPYYWRAIIHDQFDGSTWLVSDFSKQQQRSQIADAPNAPLLSYSIIAEPSSQPWLYGLEQAYSNSENIKATQQGLLIRKRYLNNTINYAVTSANFSADALNISSRNQNLQVDNSALNNVQTRDLAYELYKTTNSDKVFFNKLSTYFLKQGFSYTLTPDPMTSSSAIDEFMFNKKRGFCGHYASAAAMMFRTVGIPARVVSGYLGGELNEQDNYLSIYQYDAHAWVEVYIENEGWQIFDATAVVSPERLTGSLSQIDSLSGEFTNNLNFSLLRFNQIPGFNWLRLNLENLDYTWTNWVLGFDQQKQSSLLKKLFGANQLWKIALFSLLVLISIFLSYFIYLNWPKNTKQNQHVMSHYFLEITTWCDKHGLKAKANITPLHYLSLAANEFPKKAAYFAEFASLYSKIRYKEDYFTSQDKKHGRDLVKLIKTNS